MNGRHVFPQTYQVSCYAQTEILVTFETPFDLCAGVYFLRSCMRAFIQLPSLPLCCNGGRQFWYQVSWRRSRSALKSENPFCFDRVVSLIASLKTEEKETSLHLLLLLSSGRNAMNALPRKLGRIFYAVEFISRSLKHMAFPRNGYRAEVPAKTFN